MSQTNHTTASTKLRHAVTGVLAAGLLSASVSGQAAPLNLTLLDVPDIVSSFVNIFYSAGTDTLTASGIALELDDDGSVPAEAIANGTFDLSASIDATGALSGGTLTVGGNVASLGFNSGTLLTGDLTAFGFNPAGSDPLEFTFDVTGGDAAGLWGGLTGGVILGDTAFPGDFTSDFSNAGSGVADVGVVPLPAAVWLFGSGLLGLIGMGRRSRR